MSPARYLVDTNILVRLLTGEPPSQAEAARGLFARAATGDVGLDVSPVIVAEAFYALTSFYRIPREAAAEGLSQLLQQPGVRLGDESRVLEALRRLGSTQVGFADAFLAACALEESVPVASFDKDFDRLRVPRYEPG